MSPWWKHITCSAVSHIPCRLSSHPQRRVQPLPWHVQRQKGVIKRLQDSLGFRIVIWIRCGQRERGTKLGFGFYHSWTKIFVYWRQPCIHSGLKSQAKMSPNCHIYWIYSVLVGLAWMCAVNTTDHLCWMAKKMSSVWISQQPFKSSCFDRINRCSTWMQSFTFTNTDVMSDAGRILMMFGNKHNHARLTAYAYTTHTR